MARRAIVQKVVIAMMPVQPGLERMNHPYVAESYDIQSDQTLCPSNLNMRKEKKKRKERKKNPSTHSINMQNPLRSLPPPLPRPIHKRPRQMSQTMHRRQPQPHKRHPLMKNLTPIPIHHPTHPLPPTTPRRQPATHTQQHEPQRRKKCSDASFGQDNRPT